MDPTLPTYNSGSMWLMIFIFLYGMYCWCRGEQEDESEEEQLVEGLADYYDALKDADKNALIGQEEYFQKYKMKTFSDEMFTKLKQSETVDVEKVIMGVATYRPLDNLSYQQGLQYEPNRKKEDGTSARDNVIMISTEEEPPAEGQGPVNDTNQMDATYLALNIAFLPKTQQQSFNMDTSNGKTLF